MSCALVGLLAMLTPTPCALGNRGVILVGTEQLPRIQKSSWMPWPPSTQGSREAWAWRPPGWGARHMGTQRHTGPHGRAHGTGAN